MSTVYLSDQEYGRRWLPHRCEDCHRRVWPWQEMGQIIHHHYRPSYAHDDADVYEFYCPSCWMMSLL